MAASGYRVGFPIFKAGYRDTKLLFHRATTKCYIVWSCFGRLQIVWQELPESLTVTRWVQRLAGRIDALERLGP